MNKLLSISLPLVSFICIAGCTQPGETTGIGAAAGGAIGAGLGAIIGSQTGAAGSGLAIGAVAGSAGGAFLGNAMQAQQEALRSQDEAIERQERMVRAQQSEIEELRRMNQDTPTRRPTTGSLSNKSASAKSKNSVTSQPTARRSPPSPEQLPERRVSADEITTSDLTAPVVRNNQMEEDTSRARLREMGDLVPGKNANPSQVMERDLTDPAVREVPILKEASTLGEYENHRRNPSGRGNGNTRNNAEDSVTSDSVSRNSASSDKTYGSSSCQQAEDERRQASASSDSSEKLYHLRRALRLCPENPAFHHELGKVYVTLKRPSDAEYEFKQALSVDPSYKPAQRSLTEIGANSPASKF